MRSASHTGNTSWYSYGYFILFMSLYNRLEKLGDGGEERKASEMSRSLFQCDLFQVQWIGLSDVNFLGCHILLLTKQ